MQGIPWRWSMALAFNARCVRTATVEEDTKEELIAPVQFFVEVSSYTTVVGPPQEGELIYKKMGGQTLAGVSWPRLILTM